MSALSDLRRRYDGPIPEAEYRVAAEIDKLAARSIAMLAGVREATIRAEKAAVKLAWLDIRRLCRRPDGQLMGLLEARRRYHETGEPYYRRRIKTLRADLSRLLDILAAHKARLIVLQQSGGS